MSVVSKTSCSHFFGRWSYLGYTHALTPQLWAEFLVLMSVDYVWTYLNTMRDLYCLWAACPCLSWSAVAMRALTWVVFVPRASFTSTLRSGSSPSPTRDSGVDPLYARNYPWTFSLHEIFTCAHLNLTVDSIWPQTDIHTTSANAVTLVRGSLRLAPIVHKLHPLATHFWL